MDTASGRAVVVKILPLETEASSGRFAREAAVLRGLDLPGVVRLLDSGIAGSRGWIVMEWVAGERFPAGRHTWAELEGTVLALLDTLARVHDQGFVHRDLKPANVLVDHAGRPTLLDFGLVLGDAYPTLTVAGAVMGTPRYMAPEQLRGERCDLRTDLYCLGLMIWEALAGDLPFGTQSGALPTERALRNLPPIGGVLGGLPDHVATALDALLARRPSDRPSSARRVARALRGEAADAAFPWLGPRDVVTEVVMAAQAGRTIRVGGGRGSGRTRLLAEVASILAAAGWSVRRTAPDTVPLRSLRGAFGAPANDDRDALATMRRWLSTFLDDGGVLLVDDLPRTDSVTRRLIDDVPGAKVVVDDTRVADVRLPTLGEAELRPLFHGPERLLHLPEDGARLLARRTGGRPAQIAAEVDRWVAVGVARWDDDRLRIERSGLQRIEAGFAGLPAEELDDGELPADLDELLAWVHLAGPACTVDRLARARQEPRWQVELALAELEARGGVVASGDVVEPIRPARALQRWETSTRLAAHAAVARATPAGAPGRLAHLVAVADAEAAVAEARVVAASLAAEGASGAAMTAIEQGLAAARDVDVADLLRAAVVLAIEDGTRPILVRADDAIRRRRAPRVLSDLLAVALDLVNGRRDAAAARIAEIGDAGDLERLRWELRVRIARGDGGEAYAAVVELAARWAAEVRTPEALAARAMWRSTWAYNVGHQQVAAAEAEAGLALAGSLQQRLRFLMRALSCRLELADIDAVRRLSSELIRTGRDGRVPIAEAYGSFGERALLCRLRVGAAVDEELVEAASYLGAPEITATVLITEASIAWVRGDRERCAELALAAEAAYREASQPAGAAWSWALRLACGGEHAETEACVAALVASGRDDVTAQGLAILASTVGIPPAFVVVCKRSIDAIAGDLDPAWPRGVLSISEMRAGSEISKH